MQPGVHHGGQLEFNRVKSGKKIKASRKRAAISKVLSTYEIHNFRYVTSSYSGAGAYPLTFVDLGAGASYGLPVYMFDLSMLRRNDSASGATVQFGCPFQRLTVSSTGSYSTLLVQGRDTNDTVLQNGFNVEAMNNTVAADTQSGSVFLDYANIRLLAYGPLNCASYLRLQLVQFPDSSISPGQRVATTQVAAPTFGEPEPTGTALNEWNAMWAEYTAPLLGNPIAVRNVNHMKNMKIISTKTFHFEPRNNTVDGPTALTGNQQVIKWFHRINKLMEYQSVGADLSVNGAETINPQETSENVPGSTSRFPYCRDAPKRLYLIISAYTPVTADAVTNTAQKVGCSFDLNISRKITVRKTG